MFNCDPDMSNGAYKGSLYGQTMWNYMVNYADKHGLRITLRPKLYLDVVCRYFN